MWSVAHTVLPDGGCLVARGGAAQATHWPTVVAHQLLWRLALGRKGKERRRRRRRYM